MIESCKALTTCELQAANSDSAERPEKYWSKILRALQRHSSTLRILAMRESQEFRGAGQLDKEDWEIQRVDGFQLLHALQALEVPWAMLMGKPSAKSDHNSTGEHATCKPRDDWAGHPQIRNVIPPNFRTLTCAVEFWHEPEVFYNNALQSLLSVSPENIGSLQTFNCVYCDPDGTSLLPMDFSAIEDAYREHGVSFSYEIRTS